MSNICRDCGRPIQNDDIHLWLCPACEVKSRIRLYLSLEQTRAENALRLELLSARFAFRRASSAVKRVISIRASVRRFTKERGNNA